MTARERVLATGVLGAVLLAGGAFLFHQFFWKPLQERDARIATLNEEIQNDEDLIIQGMRDKSRLDRWRRLSLPPDLMASQREYAHYLEDLMIQNGFAPGSFQVTPKPVDEQRQSKVLSTRKEPVYTPLQFLVETSNARLEPLVHTLEGFYRTGLLHQIKSLTIEMPSTPGPSQAAGDLQVKMLVEALIVAGAEKRNHLLPNMDWRVVAYDAVAALAGTPAGLALAGWAAGPTGPAGPGDLAQPPRNYAAIVRKDIFRGPPEEPKRDVVDVTEFTHLTDISFDERPYPQATLYDRYNNKHTRLRTSPGFNKFIIRNGADEVLVDAKVVHIVKWDVIFSVGERYYQLHVGDSIQDALKKPLDREQVDALTRESERAEASLRKD